VAGEIRGLRERRQLLGPELLLSIGRGEELVGFPPPLPIARVPGSVEEGFATLAHESSSDPAGSSRILGLFTGS
jgi:hypothetical protein